MKPDFVPGLGQFLGPAAGLSAAVIATVRHRTKVTKGPGSRAAGPAMAFKLIEAAQDKPMSTAGPPVMMGLWVS